MTKPYPTIAEIAHATGYPEPLWDRLTSDALIKAICDLDREREAPAEDRIPWVEYPWAKWAAKDADGSIHVYASKPSCYATQWKMTGTMALSECFRHMPLHNATIPGPWQDSLRARPENV